MKVIRLFRELCMHVTFNPSVGSSSSGLGVGSSLCVKCLNFVYIDVYKKQKQNKTQK